MIYTHLLKHRPISIHVRGCSSYLILYYICKLTNCMQRIRHAAYNPLLSKLLSHLSERGILGLIFHLITEGVSPCSVENGFICYNEISRTADCRNDKCLCSMIEVSPRPRNSSCSQHCGDGRSYACNCSCLGPRFHCFWIHIHTYIHESHRAHFGALLCSQNFHVSLLLWTRHLLFRDAMINDSPLPSVHSDYTEIICAK